MSRFDIASLIMPPEKVAARRSCIGASDMPIIMSGIDERVLNLWRFKRGGEQDDLSTVLPVMLGCATEGFNVAWMERETGLAVRDVEPRRSGLMSASPDGMTTDEQGDAVIDAKHVGTFKSDADIIAYYQPQLHAQMHVFGVKRAYISVIKGNSDYFHAACDWDADYGALVVERAAEFWECVTTGEPPVALPAPKAPKPVGVIEYNMDGQNEWASHAVDYLETVLAADRHEIAKKSLKSLVPEDATQAMGHGICIKRGKNGALRFSNQGE